MNKRKANSKFCYVFLSLMMIINILPVNAKVFFLEADYYQQKVLKKDIVVGQGEILTAENSIKRIAITDPSIADLQVIGEDQIFVRGSRLGTTTVLVWEEGSATPARFQIAIIPDLIELKKLLHELDPGIKIEYIPPASNAGSADVQDEAPPTLTASDVQEALASDGGGVESSGGEDEEEFPRITATTTPGTNLTPGRIILSGEVKDADVIAKALQIAGGFVNDAGILIISQAGGQVINAGGQAAAAGAGAGAGGGFNLVTNSGGVGGGLGFGAGGDTINFTSNRNANLSRGVIITTTGGRVVSFLTVKDKPQIAVTIRFYEITRSLTRSLGINSIVPGRDLQIASLIGGPDVSTIGQSSTSMVVQELLEQSGTLSQTIGGGATGAIFDPKNGIGLALQALQERGEVKSLSEPTLVIANGEPASFLAGGEVPVQRSVVQAGGATQDISFEPFGIKVSILPTITTDDSVHLQIVPEIREIDSALSDFVSPAGGVSIRPPAFRTRRTQTQIELMSGQAFAISGLLTEQNTRNLSKIPGVADIPILGSLFRSKSFRRGETELLVVVSPTIVKPTRPEKVAKLSIEESPPEEEFNALAPLKKPNYDYGDEIGPDATKVPINPRRYYGDDKAKPLSPVKDQELNLTQKSLRSDQRWVEKKGEIVELSQKIGQKKSAIKDFNKEIYNKKTEMKTIENQLDRKSVEITKLDNVIEEKKKVVNSLDSKQKEELKKLEEALKFKKDDMAITESKLLSKYDQLKKAENNAKELDKRILEMNLELNRKIDLIRRLEEPIRQKKEEISNINRQIQYKREQPSDVKNYLEKKKTEYSSYKKPVQHPKMKMATKPQPQIYRQTPKAVIQKPKSKVNFLARKPQEKSSLRKDKYLVRKEKQIAQLEALLKRRVNQVKLAELMLMQGK